MQTELICPTHGLLLEDNIRCIICDGEEYGEDNFNNDNIKGE